MKVLRPGRQAVEWSREVTCTGKGNGGHGCNALLLVGKDDLFKTFGIFGDGSPNKTRQCVSFKCPECETITDMGSFPTEEWASGIPQETLCNLLPRLAWEATQVKRVADAAQRGGPREPETFAQLAGQVFNGVTAAAVRESSSRPCRRCGSSFWTPNPMCDDCGSM